MRRIRHLPKKVRIYEKIRLIVIKKSFFSTCRFRRQVPKHQYRYSQTLFLSRMAKHYSKHLYYNEDSFWYQLIFLHHLESVVK